MKKLLKVALLSAGLLFPTLARAQETLSLDQVVEEAVRNNLSLKNTRLEVKKAENMVSIVKKQQYFPTLRTTIQGSQNWTNRESDYSTPINVYTGVPLFDRARSPTIEKRKNNVKEQEVDVEFNTSRIILNTSQSYYSARLTRTAKDLLTDQILDIDRVVQIARETKDESTIQDFEATFIARRREQKNKLMQMQVAYSNQIDKIKSWMSRTNESDFNVDGNYIFPKKPEFKDEETITVLKQLAIPIHTQYENLNQQQSRLNIKLAEAIKWPQVSLGANKISNIEAGYDGYSAQVTLNWRIYDWGESSLTKENALISLEQMENAKRQKLIDIDSWIRGSYKTMMEKYEVIDPEGVKLFMVPYDLATGKIGKEKVTAKEVEDAMDAYYDARYALYENLTAYRMAELSLRYYLQDFETPLDELVARGKAQ